MSKGSLALLLLAGLVLHHTGEAEAGCPSQEVAVYRMLLETHWNPKQFPKHYPEWRPPAQWSKMIGLTHGKDFTLFRMGQLASEAVKAFAETGGTEKLDEYSQDSDRILDFFQAPAIPEGVGQSEVHFFLDGNRTSISAIAKVVPSPDWFIGVDSQDLCPTGTWKEAVKLKLDPLDAGIDKGLTFTSPNWPSIPAERIHRITSRYPDHPASSFYYPSYESLPPLAHVTLTRERVYISKEHFDAADHAYVTVTDAHNDKNRVQYVAALKENTSATVAPLVHIHPLRRHHNRQKGVFSVEEHGLATPYSSHRNSHIRNKTRTNQHVHPQEHLHSASKDDPSSTSMNMVSDLLKKYQRDRKKQMRKKRRQQRKQERKEHLKMRPPRDCRVSEWATWSPCSRTCGIGEQSRLRKVTKHAKRGGKSCPVLKETTWCGSERACPRNYFSWTF